MNILFADSWHSIVFEEPLETGEKTFIQFDIVLKRLGFTRIELFRIMKEKDVSITTICGLGDYISDIDYRTIITKSPNDKGAYND